MQYFLGTGAAEGAFEGTDHSVGRRPRQISIATLAVGSQLEHVPYDGREPLGFIQLANGLSTQDDESKDAEHRAKRDMQAIDGGHHH